jgi:hypothetical protein
VSKRKGENPTAPILFTMAPSLQTTPRRAEDTERCASSSSSSWFKESTGGSPNQQENSGFLPPATGVFFKFWPSPTSSFVFEHTITFLVSFRAS